MWNEERAYSMDRALRIGNMLFKLEHYKPIMLALHKHTLEKAGEQVEPAAYDDFKAACEKASLKEFEIAWLWNYLKHHTIDLDWDISWVDTACPGDGW
jgi:hypothetical protein